MYSGKAFTTYRGSGKNEVVPQRTKSYHYYRPSYLKIRNKYGNPNLKNKFRDYVYSLKKPGDSFKEIEARVDKFMKWLSEKISDESVFRADIHGTLMMAHTHDQMSEEERKKQEKLRKYRKIYPKEDNCINRPNKNTSMVLELDGQRKRKPKQQRNFFFDAFNNLSLEDNSCEVTSSDAKITRKDPSKDME